MVQTKPLLEKFAGKGSSYYLIFGKKILNEVFGWKKGTKLNIEYDGVNKRIIISEATKHAQSAIDEFEKKRGK